MPDLNLQDFEQPQLFLKENCPTHRDVVMRLRAPNFQPEAGVFEKPDVPGKAFAVYFCARCDQTKEVELPRKAASITTNITT